MNIQEEWDKLSETTFSGNLNKEEIMTAIHEKSKTEVAKLHKNLPIKKNWALIIVISFSIGMVFSYTFPQAILILGCMNALYLAAFFRIRFSLNKVDKKFTLDNNILSTLKMNLSIFKSILSEEKKVFIGLLPFLILGGMLLPRVYFGDPLIDIVSQTKFWITLIGCVLVITPLVYYLTVKANKMVFDNHIKRISENITELERLEK